MTLNGTTYYYVTNLQGDIVALTDSEGNIVVEYVYDSWGKLISTTGSLADTVGVKNPYRYRGYRYDTETGLYYLQSRYYAPEMKRFINADAYVDTGNTTLSTNMFAYCENNSIMYMDNMGYATITAGATCPKGALNVIYKTGGMSKKTKAICSAAKSLGGNLTQYTFNTKYKKEWFSKNKYGYGEYVFTVKSMTVGKWAESLVNKYKGYYWFKNITAPLGLLDAVLSSIGNEKLQFAVDIITTLAEFACTPYEIKKFDKMVDSKTPLNQRLYMVKSYSVNYVIFKANSTRAQIIKRTKLEGRVYF